MDPGDTYKTIKSASRGIYKEKGSKFFAFAIPVSSQEETKSVLDDYRKKFHDARHHCFACMIGAERALWRSNDDGEPSGTAGKPILRQINSFGLTNILIIVIRYFGGKLLGASGLINAYRSAANEAIKNAEIIESTVNDYYNIDFPYSSVNSVMKVLKDENINQSEQVFGLECSIKISFRHSLKDNIIKKLSSVDDIEIRYMGTH